jgi:hypothetical protein
MAEVLARLREKFEESAVGGGVAGLEIIVHRLLKSNVAQYYKIASRLEKLDDALIPTVYGLVGGLVGDRVELPAWDISLSVGIAEALKGIYARYVQKEPFVVVPDPSHINAYNLDPNASVSLIVDGVDQRVTATTDANGSVSITLATPLTSGKHEIVVVAGKKAAYAVVVV